MSHRLHALACAFMALFGLHTAASAQLWVIDPLNGVDAQGGGSAAAPLKTISFASRLAAPLGMGAFLLRPGVYDNASGEDFPIELPPLTRVLRDPAFDLDAREVEVVTPLALTTAFRLESDLPIDALFDRIVIRGSQFRAIQIFANAGKLQSLLHLRDCRLGCSRGVAAQVHCAAILDLIIEGCVFNSVETGLLCDVSDFGSRLNLRVDQSRFESGGIMGILLDASVNATLDAAIRNSIVRGYGSSGLRSVSTSGGMITTRLEHVLFADIGARTIGASIPALRDVVNTGGVAGQHRVVNCLFVNNRSDIEATRGLGSFSFGTNLVEQASLIGLGGNVLGTAIFATGNSGRLADQSPGLDLGASSDVTAPFDLDDLPRLHTSSGAPDVGPYERHFGAVPAARRTAQLGVRSTDVRFVVQGPAQTPCALIFGLPLANSFGPGQLHLGPPFLDVGLVGALDATGTRELTLNFPTIPGLVGFEFGAQAFVLAAPYLGAHAARVRLLR